MKHTLSAASICSVVLVAFTAPAQADTVDAQLLDMTAYGGKVNDIFVNTQFGGDTPTAVFGDPALGNINPGSFLFGDSGAGRPQALLFKTISPVTLTGLQISGGGLGASTNPSLNDPRQIVEIIFQADTDPGTVGYEYQVTLTNDFAPDPGTNSYLFGSSVTASSFRLDFGKTQSEGSRITEVDAIVAGNVVPLPPAAWGGIILLGLAGGAKLLRLRRVLI